MISTVVQRDARGGRGRRGEKRKLASSRGNDKFDWLGAGIDWGVLGAWLPVRTAR